jgi:tetratricopeptide (TPR) repeat protein
MQDWERCGPAFDQVVTLDPRGEYTADAAYAAVLCYNNLYQAQYQGREGEVRAAAPEGSPEAAAAYAPRELTQLEAGMVRAFNRYLCFVTEADEVVMVKYRRARIYYEANHYQEAAVAFRDIAMNHPTAEQAEFAANLYLDSLNVLGTQSGSGNSACLTEMEGAIDPLARLYCGTNAGEHQDLCPVLETIRCQLRRKQAELFERNHQYREAAGIYRDIYVQFENCGDKDQLLWNAALNLEAANLVGLAIQARQNLIRLHPDSPLASKSVYLIGANYQSLAFYERAAEFYERFAREYPRMDGTACTDQERADNLCPSAPDALRNATLFRMGLGDTEQALANAELFSTNYGRSRPRETAQVHFSIGSIYERTEQRDHTIRYYRHFLRDFGRTASPHQIIQANTAIGRAMWQQDDQGWRGVQLPGSGAGVATRCSTAHPRPGGRLAGGSASCGCGRRWTPRPRPCSTSRSTSSRRRRPSASPSTAAVAASPVSTLGRRVSSPSGCSASSQPSARPSPSTTRSPPSR